MFPQIPSWDAIHPLVIHFPIALLLVAPVLIVLGFLLPKQSRGLFIGGLALMALGTIGSYLAVATGQAAGELAERTPGVAGVLERHEELAETARAIFTALTIVYAAILFGPSILKKGFSRAATTIVSGVFLLLYAGGALLLVNVAHQGGMLVHQYGVHAMTGAPSQSATEKKSETSSEAETKKEK